MTERTLRSRSFSLVREIDEAGQETSFVETDANNANQETELDRTIVEMNEDINTVTDGQIFFPKIVPIMRKFGKTCHGRTSHTWQCNTV